MYSAGPRPKVASGRILACEVSNHNSMITGRSMEAPAVFGTKLRSSRAYITRLGTSHPFLRHTSISVIQTDGGGPHPSDYQPMN